MTLKEIVKDAGRDDLLELLDVTLGELKIKEETGVILDRVYTALDEEPVVLPLCMECDTELLPAKGEYRCEACADITIQTLLAGG